jgi:RES domain-containing protein
LSVQAWRLVAAKWLATAFDGEGARLAGGRWNTRGTAVVYLAGSLSLAALELLVHIDHHRALQEHYAIPVSFDERLVLHVDRDDLSEDWISPGAIPKTQALGDAWIRSNASLLLAVPSAVIPQELNYLFNPKHPQAGNLTIGEPQPFRYDPRLLKLRPADA